MLSDREGNVWIGGTGLICLYSLKTINITDILVVEKRRALQFKNIRAHDLIQDREGVYWVGSARGLFAISEHKMRFFSNQDGLISNYIIDIMEDSRGNIWVATMKGLSVYTGGRTQSARLPVAGNTGSVFENYPAPVNHYRSLIETSNGIILVGTSSGLMQFHQGHARSVPFSFPDIEVSCLLNDSNGDLLVGTNDGLYQVPKDKSLPYTRLAGLPHHMIFDIAEDSTGRLWVGTGRGLVCIDNGKPITYTTSDGLSSNQCFSIVEDHNKQIWVGTANGLNCFDGSHFKGFTAAKDGLVSSEWNAGAGLADRSGRLWFGSNYGISLIHPERIRKEKRSFPVYITGVDVRDKEMAISAIQNLDYNQNHLRFYFAGIYFVYPGDLTYYYRLKGLQKEWNPTTQPYVSYPYLPPQRYTFQVKAETSDGVQCLEAAEITFEIKPSFWQSRWFRFLIPFTLLGFFGVLVLSRYKRSRDKAALWERNRQLVIAQRMELMGTLATGAVHDLKNLLQIILGYSRKVERKTKTGGTGNIPLNVIKDTTNAAINMVRQILAFTRRQSDDAIKTDLADLIEEYLELFVLTKPDNIQLVWQRPKKPIVFCINPTRFQQVIMNLCINAAQAMPDGGKLTVSLEVDRSDSVMMTVRDTGKGVAEELHKNIFEPFITTKEQGKGTGLGLFVVKQIVEDYGGNINVHSSPGKGATFVITIPKRQSF